MAILLHISTIEDKNDSSMTYNETFKFYENGFVSVKKHKYAKGTFLYDAKKKVLKVHFNEDSWHAESFSLILNQTDFNDLFFKTINTNTLQNKATILKTQRYFNAALNVNISSSYCVKESTTFLD